MYKEPPNASQHLNYHVRTCVPNFSTATQLFKQLTHRNSKYHSSKTGEQMEQEIERKRLDSGLEAIVYKRDAFDCTIGKCGAVVRATVVNPNADHDEFIPCPGKPIVAHGDSHGISSNKWRYVLRGEGLAVHFLYLDDIFLPETRTPHESMSFYPMAHDIGYHSVIPLYDDQTGTDQCDYLGMRCYYDGSSLEADTPLHILTEHGEDKLWEYMEHYFAGMMMDIQERLRGNHGNT